MRLTLSVIAVASLLALPLRADVVSACDYSGSDAGAQITNALAALPSAGGTVDARCQSGSLAISSTVTVSKAAQVILGVGTYTGSVASNGPIFSLQTAGAALIGTSPQGTIITPTSGSESDGVQAYGNITIKNLTLRGRNTTPSSGTATGINSGSAANVRVENVVVEEWGNMGLNTGGSSTSWFITNSTFRSNKNDGVFIATGSTGAVVSGCKFIENGAIGVDTNADMTTISNNYFYGNGYGGLSDNFGIFVGGANNCTVTGNVVERTHGQGIIIKCAGSTCTANYNTITGNSVRGGCASTCSTQDGIALDGSSSGTLKGNYIGGNTVTGLVRSGIEADGGVATVEQNRIIGNQALNNGVGIECGGTYALDNTVALNTMLGNTTAESYPSGTRTQHYLNKLTTSDGMVDVGNAVFNSPNSAPMKLSSAGQTELHLLSNGSGYGNFKFYIDSAGNLHLYDLNRSGEIFSMSANTALQTNVLFNVAIGVSGSTPRIYAGAGTPEGNVAANLGSIFLRTNGGTGTSLYVKEGSDGNNTGWVAK